MSITAQFRDRDAFQNMMNEFRGETDAINWVLCGHVNGDPALIDIVDSGNGGADELITKLQKDSVQYCITKILDIIDQTKMYKYVYIHWIGSGVPFAKLGRLGVVHGCIQKYFQPYHDYIETSTTSDISTEALTARIRETSGTKSRVVEGETDPDLKVDRFMRGTATKSNVQHSPSPHVPMNSPKSRSGKDSLEVDENVVGILDEIKKDTSDDDWCLMRYADEKCRGPLVFHAKGDGGVNELKTHLTEQNVYYGLVILKQTIDASVKTSRYASITYVGSKIPIMAKAIIGTHRYVVDKLLGSCHTAIYASCPSEISEDIIKRRLIDPTS